MAANIVTLARIVLVFLVIILFEQGFYFRIIAVFLTISVIYMDSLDGYIARKLGVASDFGALFDITGDRIIEHVYWIYFTAIGLVSFWVPVIFISRSFLVDTLRSVAFTKEGKTPFGEKSMMRSRLTRFLTASPFSRSTYAIGKVAAFVLLGCILTIQEGYYIVSPLLPTNFFANLTFVTKIIVWLVVAMNLIRGIPVLVDGQHYLFAKQFPKELKDEG